MAYDRSEGRDVHIYDAKDPSQTVLGGLHLTNGLTNTLFYQMVEIILRDNNPLEPGKYYVNGSFQVTDEPPLTRTISMHTGSRHRAFRDAVQARDGRCFVTGVVAPLSHRNRYVGFEAAHIFPLAYQGHWNDQKHSRWITVMPSAGGPINSVQNGLLLRSDVYQLFDSYFFSINPDDNYKIVCFEADALNIAGTPVDPQLLAHPDRPVDQLLRWHFRQAVLSNMKGAGEPIFEHDFPPGCDMVDEILTGPKAAERMEFELFSRLTAIL
ncbi:hypothetical protein MMC19_000509 [Ptychographa xylographoides]|nr:hypothetical protein [Ptychographa xylographoides]